MEYIIKSIFAITKRKCDEKKNYKISGCMFYCPLGCAVLYCADICKDN